MQAVILAAGEGKRLNCALRGIPKGLIEINGKTLLEYSFDALSDSGIDEVIVVVGFLGEAIKHRFGKNYKGLKIDYIANAEYHKTGSMYSFYMAQDKINGGIVLLESDLLYESRAVKALLDSDLNDCLLTAKISGSGDEVYICADIDRRIIALGKDIKIEYKEKALGELVGISKLSKYFLNKLFKKAEEDFCENRYNYHYEESVFLVSKLNDPIYALFLRDLAWVEIDKEADLKIAREEVYPLIERKRKNG